MKHHHRTSQKLKLIEMLNVVLQSHLDLSKVVQTVLFLLRYGLSFDRAIIGLVNEETHCLDRWHQDGFSPPSKRDLASVQLNLRFCSLLRRLLGNDTTVVVQNDGQQNFLTLCLKETFGLGSSFALLPLVFKSRPLALLIVDNRLSKCPLNPEDLELLKLVASLAAIAINNAQLYQKGQELAVLKERNRLAMEIQDRLAQTISGARLILASCQNNTNLSEINAKLAYLDKVLSQAYRELKFIIFNLEAKISENSFVKFVERYLREFSVFTGICANIVVNGAEKESEIDGTLKYCLYWITQELLANVYKHAEAKNLLVSLNFAPQECFLCFIDNGKGFNVSEQLRSLSETPNCGLMLLKQKVETLGGWLEIESAPAQGTTVKVGLPYLSTKKAYDKSFNS